MYLKLAHGPVRRTDINDGSRTHSDGEECHAGAQSAQRWGSTVRFAQTRTSCATSRRIKVPSVAIFRPQLADRNGVKSFDECRAPDYERCSVN